MNRPFQFDVGIPTQIRTLSPAGGWVVTAVTRQIPGLFGSTAAEAMGQKIERFIPEFFRRAHPENILRFGDKRSANGIGTDGYDDIGRRLCENIDLFLEALRVLGSPPIGRLADYF